MRSLREKEAVVDEQLEGMVQRRRALEQLERVSGVSKCSSLSGLCVYGANT